MLKNKRWLGIILSIILLVFSINGFTAYYKYTQESGANFYVGIADKADALEDTNEMRQILDDLGALLVHSKRDDAYPKNGLFGGTIQIPEAGLKFGNDPVNDDIAAYIAGEMMWKTKAELGIDLSLYYLKTEIDTLSELEAIYTKDIIDSDELAALKFTDLADTPAAYDNGKYAKSTADGVVWDDPPGGYTNLTEFVDQTAWRLFYSNTDGDVIELALGTDGQYLKSTGATSAPEFDTPTGAGDMLKATYDVDEDNEIDVAGGGTEKDSWTQYCIPYLSDTTVFGEIAIGTEGQVLKVSTGATSYEWGTLSYLANIVEDTTPEYGGPMDHNNERDTEVKTVEFNGLYDNGNSGATPTIDWTNGNYQKITTDQNMLFTFSNAFLGTITIVITYGGDHTVGFNAGYTILEEGGTEIVFSEANGEVDILKVMYLGTANNYVVGAMLDVKE